MHVRIRWTVLTILPLMLAACEGKAGPMGPAGPQGPAGEPGPGTRTVLTATVRSDGSATVQLPAAAGSLSDPPGLTCYLGEAGSGVFVVVGTDTYSGVTCGFGSVSGGLVAAVVGAPPGYVAEFVVVY